MKLLAFATFLATTLACGLDCPSDQHCFDYGPYDSCVWNQCDANKQCQPGHTCDGYSCVRNAHCTGDLDCPKELRCLYVNELYQKKCWNPNIPTTCNFQNDCAAWGAICVPLDPAPGQSYQCIYPDQPNAVEFDEE